MINRYSKRYRDLGFDVKTLGWGNEQQQLYRFSQTLHALLNESKSILDIGCGFGDYYDFLKTEELDFKKYLGLDINSDLIAEAKKQHADCENCDFEVFNILEGNKAKTVADIGVMLGVLNLNFKDKIDNYEYSYNFITKSYALVKDCLVVDFLSNRFDPDYPNEDFVFYHDPVKMLEFALTLSPNVEIKHNYSAIPQKEFMIFIYK